MSEALCWWEDGDVHKGEHAACTVAEVRYAREGDVEGGLGSLLRFQMAALHPEISLPPPSSAGWYWAVAIRGRWSAWKLASSPLEARLAAEVAFFEGVARGISDGTSP